MSKLVNKHEFTSITYYRMLLNNTYFYSQLFKNSLMNKVRLIKLEYIYSDGTNLYGVVLNGQ